MDPLTTSTSPHEGWQSGAPTNQPTPTTPTGADGLPSDEIIGTPYTDIYKWDGQQTASDDCAIRSQQFIIEQFTGQKLSEQALEQEAQANGWYNPGHGGTPIADMGKLLEAHGVPCDTYTHATVSQLADELAQGHKVIIAVNAEDLWAHDPALAGQVQASGSQDADHAVVVSGIDTTDPNNPKVLISDPGTGEALASYPLNDFLQAWKASDFSMVATHNPAPSTLPEMANFDYSAGHIPYVMGMPYEEFAAMHTYWDAMPGGYPMAEEPNMSPSAAPYALPQEAAWEEYVMAAHDAPLYAAEMSEFAAWEQSLGQAPTERGFGQMPANEEWHHG
jgi:hypothetical protein